MPILNTSPSGRVPYSVSSRDFDSAEQCLASGRLYFSAYGQRITIDRTRLAGLRREEIERQALDAMRREAQRELDRQREAITRSNRLINDSGPRPSIELQARSQENFGRALGPAIQASEERIDRETMREIRERLVAEMRHPVEGGPTTPGPLPSLEMLAAIDPYTGLIARNSPLRYAGTVTTSTSSSSRSNTATEMLLVQQQANRAMRERLEAPPILSAEALARAAALVDVTDRPDNVWFRDAAAIPPTIWERVPTRTYSRLDDPEDMARALGVVEDQTLGALRKLKQLGWVWDGKDWVYDMNGLAASAQA